MKIAFFIHTPAHVHLFRNIISDLEKDGHQIQLIARDYGLTVALLDQYGFKYDVYIKPNSRRLLKLLQTPEYILKEFACARKFKPDVLIGIGTDEPIVATLLRKPCIIINDSEPTPLQHLINRSFASSILTPSCFLKDLGSKQLRFEGYKELAYLHPDYFKPDPNIYQELGIDSHEKYFLLRFNVFDAFHDINRHGFSLDNKYDLVNKLKTYGRVFISAEGTLPPDLEIYRLPTKFHRIHHVLYYADLIVADTGTMITEAAVLGTPSIICLSNAALFGNFCELEQKYDLIYAFSEPLQAIGKALELIKQSDLKDRWVNKRKILLEDKVNVTRFVVEFIENYKRK